MGILTKEQIRELIKDRNIKMTQDINDMLKDMFADVLQEALEAEIDTELGYPKHGNIPEEKAQTGATATRKRKCARNVAKLSFAPHGTEKAISNRTIVRKHQKEVSGIEEQILALYAKGVSVHEIQFHLNRLYGVDVSPTLISNVTNRIMRS